MTPTSDSEKLDKVVNIVTRMDAKLFDSQTGFVPGTTRTLTNHGGRISRLEKWMWATAGGLAVVTFIIGHHLLALMK